MNQQITSHILMIEPVAFGYNAETAENNHFQSLPETMQDNIQQKALEEFQQMVTGLKEHGIQVYTIKDTQTPHTPDSIFPNNWVSFHADGRIGLYPMYAKNRRTERREDVLTYLETQGFIIEEVVDYTEAEKKNMFLEGTGSMILDRTNKICYASLSERTNQELILEFCEDFEYEPIIFTANQTVNGKREPIYHTNVMMCVAEEYVIICLEAIDDETERNLVAQTITQSNKEIITLTEQQINAFAGNMLQVKNKDGKKFLVMSKTAHNALTKKQIERIERFNSILLFDISTIENNGGGSVRCMMAEVFNPIQ